MIYLFNMSTSMAGTKKGSIEVRSRPVVATGSIDSAKIYSEDKTGTIESKKAFPVKKSSPTPMKMLIAQEMSKEAIYKPKTPNVIARLMGLDDALLGDPSVAPSRKSFPLHSETRGFQDSQQLQAACIDRHKPRDLHSCGNEGKSYRDVYEVRQPQKKRHEENLNEKRMAVVREKFMEAKRMAKDERLLDSKEFHDALEVLSSNRDLFLKFLEEPDSIFSRHSEDCRSIPPLPQARRITVLKPSKPAEEKTTVKEQHYGTGSESQNAFWNLSFAHQPMTEKLPHPTRIVVLKPSPRKHLDVKPPTTPSLSSPDLQSKGNHYGGLKESLSRHRRDESLLSSVFSNGYVGDDSSFHRSESYMEGDDCNNNSDSEITSSWDNTSNRCGSPYSHSSLSRASFSPESSAVIREAKKRLSERWALVASNELYQEKLRGRKSSCTLGEMLTVNQPNADIRAKFVSDVPGISSCMVKEESMVSKSSSASMASLSRSKSVPASSSSYESTESIAQDSDLQTNKAAVVEGTTKKSRNGKTSFKGRVSSLFFFKNKKIGRDKTFSSPSESSVNDLQAISDVDNVHDNSPVLFLAETNDCSSSLFVPNDSSNDNVSCKTSLSQKDLCSSIQNHKIPKTSEKLAENQDHPSPTSTLDAPFKDDMSENASSADNPHALSRSPPIESVARTLSWSDSILKSPLPPASFQLSRLSFSGEIDPDELMLVQNLLTASGINKNCRSTIFDGWHSPDIPLDPKLLDKLPDMEEAIMNRGMRSNQKLIFDCVNTVLQEIGHCAEQCAYHGARLRRLEKDEFLLDAQVRTAVKKRLSGGRKLASGDDDGGIMVVDRLLGQDIDGRGWPELMRSERTTISKEVGSQIMDKLVEDVLVDLLIAKSLH